jgi:sterol 14-demethylase
MQFILSTLFAGIINTGIMSSWMLLYLHMAPEWKAKAIAEVHSFIAQYASNSTGTTSLIDQLSQIPPQIWDDSMPVLDLCLRETIRLVFSGTTLRRVLNEDGVVVDGVKMEKGSFLAYPVTDVHLNERVFSEPGRCVCSTS